MEATYSTSEVKPLKLSESEQRFIVNFVEEMDRLARQEDKAYRDDAKACEMAYNCQHDSATLDAFEPWASRTYLPWSYDAVESWFTHQITTLVPRDDQVIAIEGETEEDSEGAKLMEKYIEAKRAKNGFVAQFGKALKQLGIKNHTCLKLYWREDQQVEYQWQDALKQDASGQVVPTRHRVPIETTIFNAPWYDVVNIDDFSFYPIHGDFAKAVKIHRTYRFYEDLKAEHDAGRVTYMNLDELSIEDEQEDRSTPKNQVMATIGEDEGDRKLGIRIKEAWIPRMVLPRDDGTKEVIKNYVVTIAGTHLIRCQPSPRGTKSPFVWCALNPDIGKNWGTGLLSPVIGLQKSANAHWNARQDEIKLKTYGLWKYYDDGVFQPENVIATPGGFVEFASAESVNANAVPLNPHLESLQILYAEIDSLKAEFENATVPKIVKGLIETKQTTATEMNLAQNSAAGKLHVHAMRIDDGLLQPMTEMEYQLIYDRIKAEEDQRVIEDVARTTQEATKVISQGPQGEPIPPMEVPRPIEEMIEALPRFVPLESVDIKVVGYQNQTRKRETLYRMQQIIPLLAESPCGKYIQWYEIGHDAFTLMELNVDRLLATKEQAEQIDEQASQEAQALQQAQLQQVQAEQEAQRRADEGKMINDRNKLELEKAKLELEAAQAERDFVIEQQRLELDAQRVELEKMRMEAMKHGGRNEKEGPKQSQGR